MGRGSDCAPAIAALAHPGWPGDDLGGAELGVELRQQLDEAQLVELTHNIALENLRGRFNVAFGVGAAGFSDGMVCAVPDAAQPR